MFLCAPALALGSNLRIDQLYHTAWTLRDGAPGNIHPIAQTSDGYLWLGTQTGLFRFDGVRFEQFFPRAAESLISDAIDSLLATPDGALWIGYSRGGISRLKAEHITNYGVEAGIPAREVFVLAADDEGTIWAALGAYGLYRLQGSRGQIIQADWNMGTEAWRLQVDEKGTLWVGSYHGGLRFLPKGEKKFHLLTPKPFMVDVVTPDFILGGDFDGNLQLAPSSCGGAATPPALPSSLKAATEVLRDHQGGLWVGTLHDGLNHLAATNFCNGAPIAADNFTEPDNKLTGNTIAKIFEDREGNIWVATSKGLDSFRRSPIVPVRFRPGLVRFTLAPLDHGAVGLTALFAGVMEIRDGKVEDILPDPRLVVHSSYRDSDGVLWMGSAGDNNIRRLANRTITTFEAPGFTSLVTKDQSGRLLATVWGKGVQRLENGKWTVLERLGKGVISLFTDSKGQVWLGYLDGHVTMMAGDALKTFTNQDGLQLGAVTAIRDRDANVWLGGERGLARFDGTRFHPMVLADATEFRNITGIMVTRTSGMWFGENRGIVHIEESELQSMEKDPGHRVNYRVFDSRDGLLESLQPYYPSPSAIEGTDGLLWFATAAGVVWIDPKHIPENSLAPPVFIQSVTANGINHRPSESLRFPPGTNNLQVAYTATSLTVPERVRFRYMLEGLEQNWQGAGTTRKAFYTNLGPGHYRFRVIACNNDGIWNDVGASLAFSIAPKWYQTSWFLVACAGAGLLMVWILYRLRIRMLARAFSARSDERLAERTRLARDLHDTLLSTIQGSKLVADHALDQQDSPESMRHALQRLSSWLEQAIQEGRAALNSLRTSTTQTNELAESLRRAIAEFQAQRQMLTSVSAVGEPEQFQAIARDDVYLIALEAIRNAFLHSTGDELKVEITYGRDLTLRISDNGQGIDPETSRRGKAGHFGLQGMRERATRLGCELQIDSSASGTVIQIKVPGRVVFLAPRFQFRGLPARIFSALRRDNQT